MQPITDPTAEHSIDIDASSDAVWAIVSDVTRIPEWSPACYRCEWIDEGARFRGFNKLNGARWSRECVVTASEPGREFAFSALFRDEESTRWRYRLEPTGSGTTVSEAYQVVSFPPWIAALRRLPGMKAKSERDTERNISTSLERLKAIAERSS